MGSIYTNIISRTLTINILVALIGSAVGFLVTHFFIPWHEASEIRIDLGVHYPQRYVEANYMHFGAYCGGIAGVILGLLFLIKQNQKA